jgi:hypothetical protein
MAASIEPSSLRIQPGGISSTTQPAPAARANQASSPPVGIVCGGCTERPAMGKSGAPSASQTGATRASQVKP